MQYSDLHLTVYITCNTLTFEAAAAAASLDDAPEEAGYGTEDGRGVKQFVQLQAV